VVEADAVSNRIEDFAGSASQLIKTAVERRKAYAVLIRGRKGRKLIIFFLRSRLKAFVIEAKPHGLKQLTG
jgi:hypothetical protein